MRLERNKVYQFSAAVTANDVKTGKMPKGKELVEE